MNTNEELVTETSENDIETTVEISEADGDGKNKKHKNKRKKERKPKKEPKYSLTRVILLSVLFGLLALVGVALTSLSIWYMITFDISFKELLYTLVSNTTGTGQSTIADILLATLPAVGVFLLIFAGIAVVIGRNDKKFFRLRKIAAIVCMVFTTFAFRIPEYVYLSMGEDTDLYENFYVDPKDVAITADGETKNLIYIYCESMETTYASKDIGGAQESDNYIPGLTALTKEGITFTNKAEGQLGGFHSPQGTGWTIAALLSTTSGVPFAFPVQSNSMSFVDQFAPDLTSLGDILEEKGYKQEFMCGSDATFGGRRKYFEQHGNYEIYDLYTAWDDDQSGIPYGRTVWWGFEDYRLFDIAKREVTELASGDQPFNFTVLTVDAHHVDGYKCAVCDNEYTGEDARLKNVLRCTDKLVCEFVEWCQQQPFYEDTVIVVSGDHPRMDKTLIGETPFDDRTIYNCIFNSAVEPAEGATVMREFTALDMFPTTLAAMGFKIEGDRLGLGTNMFSGKQTLAELNGYAWFKGELEKKSQFYLDHFA